MDTNEKSFVCHPKDLEVLKKYNPKNGIVLDSIYLDSDILSVLREEAKKNDSHYKIELNVFLREFLMEGKKKKFDCPPEILTTPEDLLTPEEKAPDDEPETVYEEWEELENYQPKDLKARINIFLDIDLFMMLTKEAEKNNTDYITVLIQKLREYIF